MVALSTHQAILNDRARTEAYAKALRNVIRPDDTVLDLGCGSGLLTLLALRAGAGHVHAVERHSIIRVASALVRENGMEDRVTFHRCDIRELKLNRRVDVVVADVTGNAGVNQHLLELHERAHRFRKSGGRVVPREIRLYLAPVSASADYREHVRIPDFDGVSLETVRALARNRPIPARRMKRLGKPAVKSIRLDRKGIPQLPLTLSGQFRVRGTVHGIALWFQLELAPRITVDGWTGYWRPFLFPIERPVRMSGSMKASLTLNGDNSASWRVQTPAGRFVHDSDLSEEGILS